MKANFFIVGTPKAGTTSLYYYLEEHPDIYMSPIKETNYFSYDEIKEQGLYYDEEHIGNAEEYLAQFSGVTDEKIAGEASVSYLFYPEVAKKIKKYNSEAKILIVLRNPVDRAFSHYLMDKRLGFVNESLEDIVHNKKNTKAEQLYYQQYIGLGYYYNQVKRYIDEFGRQKVMVVLYEDLKDIADVVKKLYQFLGVDDSYIADTDKKHNVFLEPKNPLIKKLYALRFLRKVIKSLFGEQVQNKLKNLFFAKETKPILAAALKNEMQNIYYDDIIKTGKLIEADLSAWLV